MDSRGFHVDCRLDAVDAAMAAVCAFVDGALPPEGLIRLEIAVAEALNNVVLHSGLSAGAGIDVTVSKGAGGVDVEIRDPGQPVPPGLFATAPDPAGIDPLAESGRGIPLIVALSDALCHDRAEGWNRLFLRFGERDAA